MSDRNAVTLPRSPSSLRKSSTAAPNPDKSSRRNGSTFAGTSRASPDTASCCGSGRKRGPRLLRVGGLVLDLVADDLRAVTGLDDDVRHHAQLDAFVGEHRVAEHVAIARRFGEGRCRLVFRGQIALVVDHHRVGSQGDDGAPRERILQPPSQPASAVEGETDQAPLGRVVDDVAHLRDVVASQCDNRESDHLRCLDQNLQATSLSLPEPGRSREVRGFCASTPPARPRRRETTNSTAIARITRRISTMTSVVLIRLSFPAAGIANHTPSQPFHRRERFARRR